MKNKLMDFSELAIRDTTQAESSSQLPPMATPATTRPGDIAIVGLSVRMPLADDAEQFWDNLLHGLDCTRDLPEQRRQDADNYISRKMNPGEDSKYLDGSYLEHIDTFDYPFFRFTPKEASLMNPAQRIFMETAWAAFEDGGYTSEKLAGSNTGVYVGLVSDLEGYRYKEMIHDVEPQSLPISVTGNLSCILPSRLSYLLDLRGPSMVVDTACSSSLVAVHHACNAIRLGECDMALAGGVKLNVLPLDKDYYRMGIESSNGMTRPFDDSSDGSGIGEGAAVIMLKPLQDAIKDKDQVYAVIKGSAINQDGNSMGITAPNARAQSEVIVKAWKAAGVDPESIAYIETHGTGTVLGDPIEIDGIKGAFEQYTDKRQFCAIGSVKSNIGHLYESAGITGLVKSVLSLKKGILPAVQHFDRPNRNIDFSGTPVYVNTRNRIWPAAGEPVRMGVSAFGFSGTNCHLILEQAGAVETNSETEMREYLFPLSAKTLQALQQYISKYTKYLKTTDHSLADICYTAGTSRTHYEHRLVQIASSKEELLAQLIELEEGGVDSIREQSVPESSQLHLTAHCETYLGGGEVSWPSLYSGEDVRRISIPTYPFEAHRCWIELSAPPSLAKTDAIAMENIHHYELGWVPEPERNSARKLSEGHIVIFRNNKREGKREDLSLREALQQQGHEVIEVFNGPSFVQVSAEEYVISDQRESMEQLWAHLGELTITRIIYIQQDQSFHPFFYLLQEMIGAQSLEPVDLVLLTNPIHSITGTEENVFPQAALMFGLGLAGRKEDSRLQCRSIQVDAETSLQDIVAELDHESDDYGVAYRAGARYIQQFGALDPIAYPKWNYNIRNDGLYLITGGLGGIGLELGLQLAERYPGITLALLNRTSLPAREEWDSIVAASFNEVLVRKIQAVQHMEAAGATVLPYQADVSDEASMRLILSELRQKYVRIAGVIHGAGVAVGGDHPLKDRTIEEAERVLCPKVQGTRVVDQLTREDNPDFFVMFSSIATIFSGPGQADYVAANAYQDAYATYRNQEMDGTMTVNWSTWKETGAAAATGYGVDTLFKAMTNKEALTWLDQVEGRQIERVLIGQMSTDRGMLKMIRNYPFRLSPAIESWIDSRLQRASSPKAPAPVTPQSVARQDTVLNGADDGEYTPWERKVAEVCQAILGFNEIDIHDSFFELGADSILVKQMYAQLDRQYPGVLVVADLFEHPSVHRLGGYLADKTGHSQEKKQVEEPAGAAIALDEEVHSLFDQLEDGKISMEDMLKGLKHI
ncbi:beta-ketoacyl synthase N-terminal-like domain-containing protein [Paenibacillus sp. FSL R5-0519]|uniref:type I polyketide synthase n=1 Tax=Paenibacillus sp. FSL R5-0519 TaxID=2921648 RepID=UPI0030D76735